MKSIYKIGNFILFLCLLNFCNAQNPTLPDTLKIRQIAQKEGLSQLNVLSIDFDENGYVWAGTEDGLDRFNGYEMKVFSQGENGLQDDHIRGLIYTNDTLWLATNTNSIIAYIPSKDEFLPIFDDKTLSRNEALKYGFRILELNARYMLAGTLKNCVLIDRKTLDYTVFPFPDQTRNDYLQCMQPIMENRFLLGTFLNGILELDLSKKTLQKANFEPSFENNAVYAFHRDGKNALFVGSEKGLFHFDKTSKTAQPIYRPSDENPIRCFYDWNKNQLLIGCYDGLMLLDRNTFELKPIILSGMDGKSFSPVEIVEIEKDKAGGIWFASEGKGLFYHHPKRQKFKPFRINLSASKKKDFISSFNFLREGNELWMTTDLGFVRHELNTHTYKLYHTDRLGYALAKDADNTIWGGGFNQGLQKYNRKTDRFENVVFSNGSIPDRDIVQITAFVDDSLWVATWSAGMYTVNLNSLSVKPLKINGKIVHRARTSFIDSKNRVWIGADNGLYWVKNGKSKHYQSDPENENSISNDRIFSITEDIYGNIWAATAKGLNRIDMKTDSIFRFEKQPGLPNDFIYGVLADDHGNIWVSSNFGLSMLDVETGKFRNYTEEDGLQNNEFNGKAAYKDSLGYLYFGGMNGFNVFHPDSIPINKYTGKTIIEEVELFGKPIEKNIIYTDTLYFQHNENVLTFNFSALNFLLPEKNRYRFKMEGFDKEWRPVTEERSTTYTNLNPGTYTFLVKGTNNEMLWGKPDAMTVIIQAPWYQTFAFKIGVIIFALLLASGWFFYRNYQQKQQNQLLKKMVQARTQELNESNSDLSKAITKAQEQKENIAFLMRELNHRVKNNLQLMASLLDMQMGNTPHESTITNLQAAQNRLFTIAKIHDLLDGKKAQSETRLDVFISKLAKELVAFMGKSVELSFDLEAIKVSQKKINPLGIILNELITNTIKHAFDEEQERKAIHISLKKNGKFVKLNYSDNGKGIDENLKTTGSLGLKLIRNLAVQLGGRAEITSKEGTHFRIYFEN